jgi:hypothetical protein
MKTIKRNTTWCCKEIEEDFNNKCLYGNLSYATLCKLCFTDMILCNNITDIDESIYDNLEWQPDEEDDDWEYPEIYQFYLVDTDSYFFEEYKENFLMSYSDKLDLWVLCVGHFGTSWKYISSGVKIIEKDVKE